MATQTRLANKTKWALTDIEQRVMSARSAYKSLLDRNRNRLMDPIVAMDLAVLSDALNDIDRIARLAQDGEYEQERMTHD